MQVVYCSPKVRILVISLTEKNTEKHGRSLPLYVCDGLRIGTRDGLSVIFAGLPAIFDGHYWHTFCSYERA